MSILSLLFILQLIHSIQSIVCPPNYSDGGDGNCYSNIYSKYTRNYAYNLCSKSGGYLYDINNAFQNTNVQQKAASSNQIWIGLTCLANDKTSCMWDATGKNITSSSYSNFAGGSPDISIGVCAYMDVKSGLWYSADCAMGANFFGCKYTPGVIVPTCATSTGVNLYESFAFRGACYWTIVTADLSFGASTCSSSCGAMTSIHNMGENSWVKSLALSTRGSTVSNLNYVYIGLLNVPNPNGTLCYWWDDGTPYDFSNFGYEQQELGLCQAMALVDDLIPAGKWITETCGELLPLVCKKDWQNDCDTTPTTKAPNTVTPSPGCPQFLTYNGTFSSPSYPNATEGDFSCEYLVTVEHGKVAVVDFTYLFLSIGSMLSFHSHINDYKPYMVWNGYNFWINDWTVKSSTNLLRIYFNSTVNSNEGSGSNWSADFYSAKKIKS